MSTYFIQAHSFAAPFASDTSFHYVEAVNVEAALESFARDYLHPCGLYAADAYASADDFHKGRSALARWRSNASLADMAKLQPKEGQVLA